MSDPIFRGAGRRIGAVLATLVVASATTLVADPSGPFPESGPADRGQAAGFVAGSPGAGGHACLTARIADASQAPFGGTTAVRRAVVLLRDWRSPLADEQVDLHGAFRLRYTIAESAPGSLSATDLDGNGHPDALDAVAQGLSQARGLFSDRLGLLVPWEVDVLLADLAGIPGYLVPSAERADRTRIVLEARQDSQALRQAAIHQYAHAAATMLGPDLPVVWSEALAVWAVLSIDGRPAARTIDLFSNRLTRLGAGLFAEDLDLAAGNGLWLDFLERAYGLPTLRAALAALAQENAPEVALDRALRMTAGESLADAFREFHLWTVLVGPRSDRHHFPFGPMLGSTAFASSTDGLPALSVQDDPAVAPWGAATIRLRPQAEQGGLRVHFEGEFGGSWESDLLLVGADGKKRRVHLPLDVEKNRGEITVPLDDVAEVLVLVRNVTAEETTPRRYTYAGYIEPHYPFEMVSLEARAAQGDASGVSVVWETAGEQNLVGFNVLRIREEGGRMVTVNPVWVPALGDAASSTSYQFLDAGIEPDVPYLYRIQGITRDGLTRVSGPVHFRPTSSR